MDVVVYHVFGDHLEWSPVLRTTTLHLGDNCIGFLDVSLYRYSDTSRYSEIHFCKRLPTALLSAIHQIHQIHRDTCTAIQR